MMKRRISMAKQFGISTILLLFFCEGYAESVFERYWENIQTTFYGSLPEPEWGNCTPSDYLLCTQIRTNESATTAMIRTHYFNGTNYDHAAQISDYIRYVGRPLIYCIGLICNTLTICVSARKELRRVATCQFLIAVAVADILILINGIFYWIEYELLIRVMTDSEVICKITVFTVYCGPQISAITLIVMSIERLVRVIDAPAHDRWFSIKKTRLYIVIIVLVMVFLNIVIFFSNIYFEECCKKVCWNIYHDSREILELHDERCNNCTTGCDDCGLPGMLEFYKVYKWVAFVIYWALPFCCLPVINGWLLYEVYLARKRSQRIEEEKSLPIHFSGSSDDGDSEGEEEREKAEKEVTIMLVLVTASYCILTTGFNFIQAGVIDVYGAQSEADLIKNSYVFSVFILLFYLNHASNFFLYCISVRPYREELKCMLKPFYECIRKPFRKISCGVCRRRDEGENDTDETPIQMSESSRSSYGACD
ncbi:uncharacterized protein LOC106167993 [Lingula anatina]|uniref:Uncharacterized protein LOC106167993 n=1 Tax=Lingula anatina TaxID=7574 RepID=A0A1S3IVZ3_LINAN|nr:uncharacterized protein LOC106167993 [Lingula anatina]|eukprot:XP_013402362.1 uncharacterized protein LOC106167993 [Lingula anatina]